jgi:N-acetylmuramoyl-L-alanine amidase
MSMKIVSSKKSPGFFFGFAWLGKPLSLLSLGAVLLSANAPQARAFNRPFKVVIDPGHGGSDTGTTFYNGMYQITEKSVTLLLARQVSDQLRAEGIDATLTRRDDRDLSLGKRTELANRLGADLFLSIHMNSTHVQGRGDPEGVETYILNNATDASSRRLAHLENTVISHVGIETPEQADVALILRDMRLDANLSESKRLACALQSNLAGRGLAKVRLLGSTQNGAQNRVQSAALLAARRTAQRNRGVKQALFHVLLGADMPSVLVEAGFLSSAHDRAIVLSPDGRKMIANAIVRAIEQYRSLKGTRAATVALNSCKVH